MSMFHLYCPVEQFTGQDFQGGATFAGESSQSAEETRGTRVPDHVTWMEHVQRLKVIVNGVPDDHFALKYAEDLQVRSHISALEERNI